MTSQLCHNIGAREVTTLTFPSQLPTQLNTSKFHINSQIDIPKEAIYLTITTETRLKPIPPKELITDVLKMRVAAQR